MSKRILSDRLLMGILKMKVSSQLVPSEGASPVIASHARANVGVIGGIVRYTAGAVLSMPRLEEPVYDKDYLPENTNVVQSVAYTWLYNFKQFEYKVDPFRRGFLSWIRLVLAIAFFIGLPLVIVLGMAYGAILCIVKFCGVLDVTFELIKSALWVMLGLIGVILLAYFIYFVLAVIFGWQIKVPSLNIARPQTNSKDDL